MLINETQTKLDPRVKRTRKLLQQAFSELLTEKDFHNITVHDIAERAEVNRATFYLHFEDKYALLAYSVREALQGLLDKRLPDAHTLTLANLRLLAAAVFEFMGEFFGHCQPTTRNDLHTLIASEIQQHVSELLLRWLSNSEASSTQHSLSPEHAAAALSWIIFGSAFESQRADRKDRKQSPEQWADQMLSFLVRDLPGYLGDPI